MKAKLVARAVICDDGKRLEISEPILSTADAFFVCFACGGVFEQPGNEHHLHDCQKNIRWNEAGRLEYCQ